MPFGMSNAPATMQRYMQKVLGDLPFVTLFIDDICVFSNSEQEHAEHLAIVLERLERHDLRANARKCHFFQPEISHLGHTISHDSVRPDPAAVAAVTEMPSPTNAQELRRFLGLANWLRKYIKNFASISAPLHALTGKRVKWEWTPSCQLAFQSLKLAVTTSPALLVADPNLPYVISYDSCVGGIGGTLLQNHGNGLQPVAYRSRTIKSAEADYFPWELEVRGLLDCIHAWHKYIDNGHFLECVGDHAGLTQLMKLAEPNRRQAGWIQELMPYISQNSLTYAKGSSPIMAAPDATSRSPLDNVPIPEPPHILPVLPSTSYTPADASSPDFPLLQRLLAGYDTPAFKSLASEHNLSLHRSLWFTSPSSHVIAVPDDQDLRAHLISSFHDVPYVQHRGRDITIDLIKSHWWWPSLSADVARYVSECSSCQANLIPNTLPHGQLNPEEIAADVFKVISMDFIFHLAKTPAGNTGCLTVVDKASRACILIPIKDESISAAQTALLFRKHVFSRGWGIPEKILSDRDTRFTSAFWRTLLELLGARIALSSSFRPQTDGSTEIVHRELNDMIRNTSAVLRTRWDEFIDVFEFAHNNHKCSSTGFSPFEMIQCRAPRTPSQLSDEDISNATSDGSPVKPKDRPTLASHMRLHHLILAKATHNVVQAQARQKHYHDLRHKPAPIFNAGDFVWLSSANLRITDSEKTEDRWLGPFKVADRICDLTYRLILPSHMQAHNVFHVSSLRPFTPATAYKHPPPPIPVLNAPRNIEYIITHRRGVGRGGPLSFSVKYVDQPLPATEEWLPDDEARILSPAVVAAYKKDNKLCKHAAH